MLFWSESRKRKEIQIFNVKKELEGSIVGKRLHPSLKEKLQTAGLNSCIEQLGPSFLL